MPSSSWESQIKPIFSRRFPVSKTFHLKTFHREAHTSKIKWNSASLSLIEREPEIIKIKPKPSISLSSLHATSSTPATQRYSSRNLISLCAAIARTFIRRLRVLLRPKIYFSDFFSATFCLYLPFSSLLYGILGA